MDDDERLYLEALLAEHRKRLRVLEIKKAQRGIDTPPDILIEIEDIGKEIDRLTVQMHRAQAVVVDLFSFAEANYRDPAHIRLDWIAYFDPIPTPEIWATVLLPKLEELRRTIGRDHPNPIVALRPKAHLTAGLAFGYIFRAPTSIQLWVEQPDSSGAVTQWWRTDEPPAGAGLRAETQTIDGASGSETTIEMSISRNVHSVVEAWMAASGSAIHKRVRLALPGGSGRTAVTDGPHALALAYQIEAFILDERSANPSATIHLFGAMPIGLAVLLGTRLNRCGPIQCYEYVANTYQPSCRLE